MIINGRQQTLELHPCKAGTRRKIGDARTEYGVVRLVDQDFLYCQRPALEMRTTYCFACDSFVVRSMTLPLSFDDALDSETFESEQYESFH